MHPTDIHDEADLESFSPHRLRRRLAFILCIVLVILLLAFIPPLISVSRFQRRIANNISTAIGRPVHFDNVTLTMLPTPGLTLNNFVIEEDPAFGYEPILHADSVQVSLRISSLWRRHVEFSKISLTEPTSVNLVHLSDGRWNIEGLLFKASHSQSAPTVQRFAGPAARFPYIEATGARLNFKLDQDKTPFSLTESDFALWEPEPDQWRIRVEAHPVRTDTTPGETGSIRAEGTLGAPNRTAESLAQTPIDVRGDWRDAQLGGLSQFVFGNEAGVRGDVSASFTLQGTVDRNLITTDISVRNARRADFVPSSLLELQARCTANASRTFHSFTGIVCNWPPADSAERATLIVAAEVPDVRTPDASSVRITLPAVPASAFFDWLAVATPHPPKGLGTSGNLAGSVSWSAPERAGTARPTWTGELAFSGGTLALEKQPPIPLADVILRSTPAPVPPTRSRRGAPAAAPPPPDSFDLLPVDLDLGGSDPATLTGHLDDSGYTLHVTGSVLSSRLLAVGNAIPQLGDGLAACLPHSSDTPETATAQPVSRGSTRGSEAEPAAPAEQPITVDLTATRTWGGPQSWCAAAAAPAQTASAK